MYAIVDIETTGGHASGNGITEIAICIHNGKKVVDRYHTLINPHQNIPVYITALTGISNQMVSTAPGFEEVADEIFAYLNDAVFVAHNVNFDYSFLKHQLKNSGYELNVKKLCTVRLGRKIFPGLPSYSLGNFCRSMGIEIENRHRAQGDADATATLFSKMLQQEGAQVHIDKMLKKTSSEQWLPTYLDKEVIEALPNKPGVYYFHNAKGKIIYVGKAINIRKRVSSHFTHNDDGKRRQHFLRLVANITCQVCANELHALVLESTEIKRLWPKYNYSQKQPTQKFGLYSFEDGKGYIRLAIDKKKKHLKAHYYFNLLHEGLVMLIKMADQFELDKKLCYIDKSPITTKDIEFLEPPSHYNRKVNAALQALEAQLPSFALVDDAVETNKKLCMLVERGSFWGMGYIDATHQPTSIVRLKEILSPYADNDFIRNSIYSFVELNPDKKIPLPPQAEARG
ncbi:MAG TPA: exonuclease domain-containing protein [Ferruginibacter sp.]|nr:exonuclease domain-containing protein [Ferruginibacter sp.]HRE64393.1 exonuclease domain-containing protein [Ferruginibacter sp.]